MSKLDSKIPHGKLQDKWAHYKAHQNLVNPANKRKLELLLSGQDLQVPPLPQVWQNLGLKSKTFATRTVRAVHTALPRKAESMPQKTIRMTATVFTDFFTTPSKAATIALAKQTSIALPK